VDAAVLAAALEAWRGRAKPESELFRGTSPVSGPAEGRAGEQRRGLLRGRGR
jgi:hypothetical protein